jgi:bifunctional UDP-N-acetylglucosamine pyrophosphorylase/glucosamine-1-phosphate N-acetyltransferase
MHSERPKILHRILGRSIIEFVVMNAHAIGSDEIIVVVGKNAALVEQELSDGVRFTLQPEPRGTGDAARCGLNEATHDQVMIRYGDVPLLTEQTLLHMITSHEKTGSDLTLLTCHMDDPFGYGRIIRSDHDSVTGIVEQSDATEIQASIKEINAGVYFGKTKQIMDALQHISAANSQEELYLTDIIPCLLEAGRMVNAYKISDADEILGINSKKQLAYARELVKRRWLDELMMRGVCIEDPATTIIDLNVRIGAHVHIRPFTIIEGETEIADGSIIGPYAWIKDGNIQNTPGTG